MSQRNYHTTKLFTEYLLAIEMRKTQILMNKLVYLALSIFNLNKTVMYVFWYDHVKPKWWKCKTLLYVYRQLQCPCITKDIYSDISKDVETRFETLNFELDRPYRKERIKKLLA